MRTKLPKFIIVQKKKISHSLSSSYLEKRSSTFDRLFQSTFEHLPLPSPHNIPPTTTLEMKLAKTIIVQKKEVSHSLSSRGEILHLRSTPSNTFEHLPLASIPSQHSLLSALHNSGNVSKHSLTFHLFDEKNDPTRSSNRPLKSSTVSRERSRGPVPRRRNLAGLPGYQVDSEAESPGRRVHLRGCKARGSVGNRHRRAAASVRVFA